MFSIAVHAPHGNLDKKLRNVHVGYVRWCWWNLELRERWRFESYNVMTTLLKFKSISQSYVLFNIVHINAYFGENPSHSQFKIQKTSGFGIAEFQNAFALLDIPGERMQKSYCVSM